MAESHAETKKRLAAAMRLIKRINTAAHGEVHFWGIKSDTRRLMAVLKSTEKFLKGGAE